LSALLTTYVDQETIIMALVRRIEQNAAESLRKISGKSKISQEASS
jgi:hypothetical protein